MSKAAYRSPAWRGVWFALVAVALLARIGSPPGTMFAHTPLGMRLVACSGHGPMTMTAADKPVSSGHKSAHPTKAHSDGGCEFAAQAAHALSARVVELVGSSAWTPVSLAQPIVLATTGAGLAAPPPPSRAPPHHLV